MSLTTRRAIRCAIVFSAVVALVGCDDIGFQEGTTLPQSPLLQESAARSRVTPSGLESLYAVRWKAGVPLDFDRRVVDSDFDQLALGPMDERVMVSRWDISTENNRTALSVEVQDFDVVVPIRIEETVGVRICRVRVSADRMDGSVSIDIRSEPSPGANQAEALVAISTPSVSFAERTTELIGSCPPLDQADALDGRLDDDISSYVEEASAALVSRMAELSPSQELGLIDTNVELEHLTPLSNRRGSMSIFSEPDRDSARLDTTGYALNLNMAVDSFRASCAPPVAVDLAPAQPPASIPLSSLENAGADAAYALSTRTLSALAKNGARAGFACSGLEDAPFSDSSQGAVSTDELDLETVGLGDLRFGSFAIPVVGHGDIPTVASQAGTGVIELTWPNLIIDIYAEVRGVPVRILQLTTTFEFTLQPAQSRGTALSLQIGSIDVTSAQVTSQWRREADTETGAEADVRPWARRLLLLLFEDRLQLPLPVEPGAPLELISTQVRANDLLLLLRIDDNL